MRCARLWRKRSYGLRGSRDDLRPELRPSNWRPLGCSGSGAGPDAVRCPCVRSLQSAPPISVKAVVARPRNLPQLEARHFRRRYTHGELVYFYKMDNTQVGSVTISRTGHAAARYHRRLQIFGRTTRCWREAGRRLYRHTWTSLPRRPHLPAVSAARRGRQNHRCVGCSGRDR